MSVKLSILIALLFSLIAAPLAQQAAAQPPMAAKMPGCVTMKCVHGCCAVMPCCVKSQREPPPPVQAPISLRTDTPLAAVCVPEFTFLYVLPAARRTFLILDETRVVHALSPLAANCIQLI